MLLPRTACGNLAQQKFLEKLHQISCNETENKANFHFSHYNSTETLSCHSNQSIYATTRKKINYFVGPNAMNNSAKVQLYPQNNFWGDDFLIFSHIWPFRCHDSQSNKEVITKIICLIEDNSINISETLLSKYLQWKAINVIFIFPIISQWKL